MTNPDNVGGLLPCPFCGGEAELVGGEQDEFCHWHVQCTVCGAISGESLAPSTPDRDFASESWNRRELCRAAPAGGECQHEWAEDGDATAGRLFCRLCKIDKPVSAPAGSGEVDLRDKVEMWRDDIRRLCRYEGHRCDFRALAEAIEQSMSAALLRKLQQGAE